MNFPEKLVAVQSNQKAAVFSREGLALAVGIISNRGDVKQAEEGSVGLLTVLSEGSVGASQSAVPESPCGNSVQQDCGVKAAGRMALEDSIGGLFDDAVSAAKARNGAIRTLFSEV